MKIQFFAVTDDRKKIRKTLSSLLGETETLYLKDDTNVINPTIDVHKDTVGSWSKVNYAYIPDFNRYYFVDAVQLQNDGLVSLSLSVDVLKSYESALMNTAFFIARSESCNSRYYIDNEYPVTARRVVSYLPIGNIPQNSGSNALNYALYVTGLRAVQ